MPAVTKSRPRPSVLRGPQPRSRPVSRRLDYKAAAPEGIRGLYAPHSYVTASVPRPLLDLVWLRVSQINGCARRGRAGGAARWRSEEHTSELQSLMRISYAVFCLKKKKKRKNSSYTTTYKTTSHKQHNKEH